MHTTKVDINHRLVWVDVLKVITCLGIILIHFTESVPNSPLVRFFTLLPRTSVQIFLLLGGVTLYAKTQVSMTYFLKKMLYLVLALIVFRFVYYIYLHQTNTHFWQNAMRGYWHLWYLYTIIPIYAISGILRPPLLSTQKEVHSFIFVVILALFLFSSLGSPPLEIFFPGQQGPGSTLIAFLYILLGYGLNHLTTSKYIYIYIYIYLLTVNECIYYLGI